MKKFAKVMAVVLVAVMAMAILVACGPASDPDKAVEALKKNEYAAAKDTLLAGTLKLLGVGDIKAVVVGTNGAESITIVYFDDASAANDAWDKLSDYAEDQKKDSSDWQVKKSGAMIYWGTSAAIKAAK